MMNKKRTKNTWRYLTYLWTILFYVAIILDFCGISLIKELFGVLAAIYVAVLAIYVSDKEFERWQDLHSSQHPGELFVIGWSLLIIGLLVAELIANRAYRIPDLVVYVYITVLGVLAITRKSKDLYEKKSKKLR